ncbi:hypothetical protein Pcinc_002628 [Petrolisthes cinctipes]|uniref:Ionotropic glutamate receptor C-terminal domain-containing protein n=1 Tax=Petrolisthes cinctipes TaxID=88211 RepID=A0AAE1GHU5_PETCI|nr:hypothetical protein Pcinc_008891 [Petrolisthes cinctipes]KAK3893563.1 hypothetical protein Pcinc_002628 [Petrolisthes cinctipes]
MLGHKFNVITARYFPYMDYSPDSDKPGSTVTLQESVDANLLLSFADKLNFTFEIREEPNRSWGVEKNGTYDGMMGLLQREEKDFCTVAGPSAGRLKVTEYARGYPSDMVTVISLKPTTLPQYLSLVRPFSGQVWMAMVGSVVFSGLMLWTLQKIWAFATGGRGVQLNLALLYSWGALLEQPPPELFVRGFGQMLVGWWLVACLIFSTGFKSSLIAHLTVQGKALPIKTFEHLVAQPTWEWGTEAWLLKGIPLEYFSKHTDPVVIEVYRRTEVLDAKEALMKVVKGGYSFISFKNYITVLVASEFADITGQTPFYISNQGIYIQASFGWGFRKGAPFYSRFLQQMNYLEDGGLIRYWTEEAIARRVREKKAAISSERTVQDHNKKENDKEVVLGLMHLQGVFYLLFLGAALALCTLLVENISHYLF